MDLAKLAARLDKDEAAARAVAPLGYVWDMGGHRLDEKFSHGRIRFASEDGRSRTEPDPAAGRHFARYDPARALRVITAQRRILERHSSCTSGIGYCQDGGHGDDNGCAELDDLADMLDLAH